MAAGTESAVDTRTYNSPSLVGNIVEKVLIARQLAENERKFVEKKAAEAGTSLEEVGIEKGFFFKQALRGEFGGNFVDKKTKQLKGIVKKYKIAKRISKNPKVAFNFIKPILVAKSKQKVSGAQTKMFRAKFDYTNYDEVTTATPKTPVVGATAKKIQKATTSKSKRISREELLSSITEIANSLNKTADSIGRTTSGVSASVISSTNASMQLVEQLKTRNNTLEDKLNEIAKAISEQTQLQRQSVSRSKAAKAEERLENQTDVASVETPDDTATAENETLIAQLTTPTSPITNVQNISSSIGATSSQRIENQQMNAYNDIPQAERGGIISGPDSGYLAKLHGDELIVPLKNNYTEGKKSAVDGKVRRRPSSNSSGGVTTSSLGGRFGFGIANMTGIGRGGSTQSSALTQPLVDAMSLIPIAVGGGTLAQLTSLMSSMGSEAPIIGPYIQQTSRSLANVFGLPSAIVNKATGKTKAKEGDQPKDKEEGESKKNILQKMMEGFGKLLEKLREGINKDKTDPDDSPTGTGSDSAGENLAAFISTLEATGEQNQADVMQVMVNRAKGDSDKLFHEVTGKAQFTPASSAIYGATGHDPAADKAYGHIAPLLGNTPEERKAKLREIAAGPNGINNLRELFRTGDAASAAKVLADFKTGGPLSTKSRADVGGGVYFKGYTPESGGVYLDRGAGANKFHTLNGSGGKEGTAYQLARSAPPPPQLPSTTPQPVQKLTENYGHRENTRIPFNLGGKEYHAYRGGDDWAFFEGTGIGAKRIEKGTEKYNLIREAFINLKERERISSISPTNIDTIGSINAPAGKPSVATAQAISTPLDSTGQGNVVAMMLPQGEQSQTATTTTPPTHETATASGAMNPLINTGHYSNSLFT
jgi:hypothetical protein